MRIRGRRLLAMCVAIGAAVTIMVAPATAGSDDDSLRGTGQSSDEDTLRRAGGTGATTDDEALAELVSYLPSSFRYNCVTQDPNDATLFTPEFFAEAANIRAVVSCVGEDEVVATNHYWLFADADAMNRVYLDFVTRYQTGAFSEDCPANGKWGFGGGEHGLIACFLATQRGAGTIPPAASRIWTDDRTLIIGEASLPDGDADFAKLRDWWDDEAGPTRAPDDDGIASDPDPDAGEELLAAIPKPTRKSCETISPSDVLAEDTSIERLYLEAAVECLNPAPGIEVAYYYMVDPEVIEALHSELRSPSEAELDETDDDAICPAYGSWSLGKGKNEREIGSYSCFFFDTETGTYPAYNWTDTEQGILGEAQASDEDPTRLEQWWDSSASGPLQP